MPCHSAFLATLCGSVVACGCLALAETDARGRDNHLAYTIPPGAEERRAKAPHLVERERGYAKASEYWLDGKKVGERAWLANGVLVWELPMRDGKAHGIQRRWGRSGVPSGETAYRDGLKHGFMRRRANDGKVWWEMSFADDQAEGLLRRRHPNGQLEAEIHHVGGVKHGASRFWDKDGNLIGTCEMNRGTGVWKHLYEDGTVSQETPYENGKVRGYVRQYHRNGQLRHEQHQIGDTVDGRVRSWSEDGILLSEGVFRQGRYWGGSFLWHDGTVKRYEHGRELPQARLRTLVGASVCLAGVGIGVTWILWWRRKKARA